MYIRESLKIGFNVFNFDISACIQTTYFNVVRTACKLVNKPVVGNQTFFSI